HGAKRLAGKLRVTFAGGSRQARAGHVAQSNTCAVERRAVLDDRQAAAAAQHIARGALPLVTALRARGVQCLPRIAEARVQADEILARALDLFAADRC